MGKLTLSQPSANDYNDDDGDVLFATLHVAAPKGLAPRNINVQPESTTFGKHPNINRNTSAIDRKKAGYP
ncbi:hypothetical protein V3C99_000127 [Haemonchus contortus]